MNGSLVPERVEVAIIGAGVSGLLMAVALRRAGIESVVILEKSARLGGTWRDNVYPGVACDVPARLYAISFAPNPDWSARFAPGAEILQYLERFAEAHDVARFIRYGQEVQEARWTGACWQLATGQGRPFEARVVVAATGALHQPAYPAIEGLGTFAGLSVHAARWPSGLSLAGRRVGVVGSAATAAQLVPAIAPEVAELRVFQRSPSWVLGLANPSTTARTRERVRRWPRLARWGDRVARDVLARTYGASFVGGSPATRWVLERRCRQALEAIVDPALRSVLTPAYKPGCKRIVFSNTYHAAFERPNVRLVTKAVVRAVPEGLETADGTRHDLDCLVMATGFRADRFVRPMSVSGEGGASLDAIWAEKPVAYRSVSVPRMPNFFLIVGPHSPIANLSVIEVAEWQVGYVTRLIDIIRRRNVSLSATEEATAAYVGTIEAEAPRTVWASGCTSWYHGRDGVPGLYTLPPLRYRAELARPPHLAHFKVDPLP